MTPPLDDTTDTPSGLPGGAWFDPAAVLRPPERPDEIGRLGGFRVLRVLGRGGMGAVLGAEDTELRRHVALKVMRPDLTARPEARTRFRREAQSAAAVVHDNIIPVYAVGVDHGVLFIVMPLLDGETLEDRLARGGDGALPVGKVLRVGAEAADGLAAAHARGLVHRDIKPANLWLEGEPGAAFRRVKILDFGLARAAHEDTHLTAAGGVLGTPAYMSPEQAAGEDVDHRTDLFSLGAVLYRGLTGRLPFPGSSTMAILSALANKAPEPVRALNPSVPADLAALVERLLSKNPAARPASAAEVAAELTRIRAAVEGPSHAETVTLAAPKRRQPRRRWAALLALACALLAVAAGAGVIVVRVKGPGGKETEVRVPEGSKVDVDAKGNVVVTLPGAPAGVAVAPMPRPVDPPELECVLKAGDAEVHALVMLPDNDTVVAGGIDGRLRVWSLKRRAVIREHGAGHAIRCLALHPDGKTVAVHTDRGDLFTWDSATGNEVRRYTSWLFGPAVYTYCIDFTPDGAGLVVADYPGHTISLVDVASGWHRVLYRLPDAAVHSHFCVSPDGSEVAVVAPSTPLQRLTLPGGEVRGEVELAGHSTAPAYTSDGRRLIYPSVGWQFAAWDRERAVEANRYVDQLRAVPLGVAVNRTNTLFAAAHGEGGGVEVWALNGSPRAVKAWPSPGKTTRAFRLAFTPDGTRLISVHDRGTICVFRVSPEWGEPRPAYPPLDPAWLARVKELPAAEQVREVSAELVRRNPGFDGKLDTREDGGRVVGVGLATNHVEDIAPVRALTHLTGLNASGVNGPGKLWYLSPLAGMKLTGLTVQNSPLWDLRPLKGMPLRGLPIDSTAVRDLTPLAGMKLAHLGLTNTQVRDLTPLIGMNFEVSLFLHNCYWLTDIAPLRNTKIRYVMLPPGFRGDLSPLAGTGLEYFDIGEPDWRPSAEQRRALETISTLKTIRGQPVAEYWWALDAAKKE